MARKVRFPLQSESEKDLRGNMSGSLLQPLPYVYPEQDLFDQSVPEHGLF